jgi:hypothetical protein
LGEFVQGQALGWCLGSDDLQGGNQPATGRGFIGLVGDGINGALVHGETVLQTEEQG